MYSIVSEHSKQVNTIVECLVTTHDASLLNTRKILNQKSNLYKDEKDGVKWLKEMSDKNKISVVRSDKGGALLILKPDLLKKKVLEKLEDTKLYTRLIDSPLNDF